MVEVMVLVMVCVAGLGKNSGGELKQYNGI